MKKTINLISLALLAAATMNAETVNEDLTVNGKLRLTGEAGSGGDGTLRIDSNFPAVTSNGTNYNRLITVSPSRYNIPSGVVDNGYRIGITVDGYAYSNDFEGTLHRQVGAWLRVGHYQHPVHGNPTGHIDESIALWLENLDAGGTTVDNSYGVYQKTASSKNYFAGKVGIGTTSPQHELAVNGTIRAKEVIVDTGWSDFVFEDTYRLRSLHEVESHIEEHGHLPDVPSAAIVVSEGLSVGEAQKIMMQKIEELTLYMIEKDKQIETLQARVAELESK